jgi:hypothetical protein
MIVSGQLSLNITGDKIMSINIILKGSECEGVSFSKAINYYLSYKSSLAEGLGQVLEITHSHGTVSKNFINAVAHELVQMRISNDDSSYIVEINLNQEVQSVFNHFSSFSSSYSGEELACFKTMEVSE